MQTIAQTKRARLAGLQSDPTEAEIQHAAHQLWLEAGRPEGCELDHWFAAKERLLHQQGRSAGRGSKLTTPVHFPSTDRPTVPTSPTVHPLKPSPTLP
jgi:hypothetical protein